MLRNPNFSVQIQIRPNSQCEFVPRNTEASEFLDLVHVGGVAIVVDTVIAQEKWGAGVETQKNVRGEVG